MHDSLRRFTGRSRLRTWVFAIARNIAIDDARAAARRPVPVETRDESDSRPADDQVTTRVEIHAALADLPPSLREVFVLVELLGLRYREVAQVLDVPEGTVKSRMFHARRSLVEWMSAPNTEVGDG